jgi:hypothetical protein
LEEYERIIGFKGRRQNNQEAGYLDFQFVIGRLD